MNFASCRGVPALAVALLTLGAAVGGAAVPDSIPAASLVRADQLAAALADTAHARPLLLQVGFKVLYRSGHITGSRFVGPGSKPEGRAGLAEALKGLPKRQPVVLYCGCCPWNDCPNVRPAYAEARALGFADVKVLRIEKNLQRDWIEKGLPFAEDE